ncbi:MAG: hypothetical protein ABGY41_06000 [Candidatus Poribacteria bacterium]
MQVIGVAHCELDEQPVEEFIRRHDIEFPVGLANKGILEDYGI